MNARSTAIPKLLLRSPRVIADTIARGEGLRSITIASLASIVLGTVAYGGVVGSLRGGAQILFAAMKMPLVALLTLSLVAPAIAGASRAFDLRIEFPRATTLVLAATARAALVLLAVAPALALFATNERDYHVQVLLAAAGFALAGASGLPLLWHGIPRGAGRVMLAAFSLSGFVFIGAQSAWILRPWITRPTSEITFARAPEGAFISEGMRATRSANGYFDRERAPEASR